MKFVHDLVMSCSASPQFCVFAIQQARDIDVSKSEFPETFQRSQLP